MKSRRKSAFYVYMHCRPDGSVFYVGKGCGKRARDFASRSQKHHEIVAQFGRKNILVMLIPCESDADACLQEIRLINNFRVLGFELINQTGGGDGLGTKAALAAGKARGTQAGGRRVSLERWAEIRSGASLARMKQSEEWAANVLPAIRTIQAEGARSLRQIAAGLNERNISTPRGGDWSAVQVQRVLTAAHWHQVHQKDRQGVER